MKIKSKPNKTTWFGFFFYFLFVSLTFSLVCSEIWRVQFAVSVQLHFFIQTIKKKISLVNTPDVSQKNIKNLVARQVCERLQTILSFSNVVNRINIGENNLAPDFPVLNFCREITPKRKFMKRVPGSQTCPSPKELRVWKFQLHYRHN